MIVKKQAGEQGQPAARSVQFDLEVAGTPGEVWRAIATGPGITSWFTPTEVDERESGAVVFHLGPDVESRGVVTAWEPPHRFAYEERDWLPGAPPLATECLVEARSGGLCRVRLVSSLFTSSAEWDDQIDGFEKGWAGFLVVLRLYLANFRGQRCSPFQVTGSMAGPEQRAWAELKRALGFDGAAAGERRVSAAGAPRLSGTVEQVGGHYLVVRSDQPAPGVAMLGAYTTGDRVHASLCVFVYGDGAPAVVAREEPGWRAWMAARFPPLGAGSAAAATAG
jgi:uncharacterized protein YndB with AHSA1/START domain